jgi:hypothetical protein
LRVIAVVPLLPPESSYPSIEIAYKEKDHVFLAGFLHLASTEPVPHP